MNLRRFTLRALTLPVAAAFAVAAAGGASAHVSVSPTTAAAGENSLLTFSNPHGCGTSPTTRISIAIPEQINAVTPTINPNWEVTRDLVELDEPVTDSHGNEITERVASITYTAKEPQPDGTREAFELSLRMPDEAGETLVFPVIQTCEDGENSWTEVAAEGQDSHDLDYPAPQVALTAGGGHDDGHGHGADEGADESSDEDGSAAEETSADAEVADEVADETETVAAESGGADALSIAALVAGLLGLAAGGLALARTRRQS